MVLKQIVKHNIYVNVQGDEVVVSLHLYVNVSMFCKKHK